MTNHELGTYQQNRTEAKRKESFFSRLNKTDGYELLEYGMIFLLTRASLFGSVSPFGLAYFAATFPKQKRLYGILFAVVGILFADFGVGALKYLGSVAIISTFALLLPTELEERPWVYGLIAALSCLVNGLIYAFFDGFLLYDIFMVSLEAICVFLSFLAFRRAAYLVRNLTARRVFENEEMLVLLLLSSAVIVSIASIPYLVGAAHVLAVLAVMTLSLTDGLGVSAMAGTLLGLLISTTGLFPSQMVGTYAVCALVSGFFKRYGKWGVSIGFFASNALMMLYFNSGTMMFIEPSYILIAALALFFLPPSFFALFGAVSKTPVLLPVEDINVRTKERMEEELSAAAKSFSSLSEIFHEVIGEKVHLDLRDVGTVFHRTTESVCKNCSMQRYCWQKKESETKQMLKQMLPMMEERGYAADIDTDKKFRENCLRFDRFLRVLNQNYEIYKVGRMWAGRVSESRQLLADQFENVSAVLKGICARLGNNMDETGELEHKIKAALDRKGMLAEEVRVSGTDGYEVSMSTASCGGKLACAKTVAATLSEVLGVPMLRCGRVCGEENCQLKFREIERYAAEVGIAYALRDGETESGDSFLSMQLSGGKLALALSDGMGSGEQANTQSRMTIRLMERLLEAGFDKETTLRLINSVLLGNGAEESFATVDMCLFHSYTGALEFIKIGAASSYILSGGSIKTVYSTSLPAGIVGQPEPDCELHDAKDGDMVILMTDGVSDAFERVGEDSLVRRLSAIRADTPQELADLLMLEAVRLCGGKPKDDMTVLCAKIREII